MDRSSAHNTRHPSELATALKMSADLPDMGLPEETEPEHRGTFFDAAFTSSCHSAFGPTDFPTTTKIGKHDHWIVRSVVAIILGLAGALVWLSIRH